MGERRRRAAVGLGAALITAAAAIALIPGPGRAAGSHGSPSEREPVTTDSARPTPSRPVSPTAGRTSPTSGRVSPAPSGGDGTSPADASGDPAAVVRGEDPLAATAVLVATREGCLRELDAACLRAVDEPGSPAERDDRDAVSRRRAPLLPRAPFRIVDALGGAVVVASGEDVRVLVLRTPEGWRVRDVTSDLPAEG